MKMGHGVLSKECEISKNTLPPFYLQLARCTSVLYLIPKSAHQMKSATSKDNKFSTHYQHLFKTKICTSRIK